ncbi:hypothetical protein E2A64_10400 [Pseudohoeflea suaedae]|uniref:Uncharacterized protein n=1 Tax=Pseudohoeflea suaedae TaxID=877384 RepID=A0A4R5PJH3_9HYPH|nr:hypothetical protein [Pseudohoeflea suaedae]TDH35736.1 hypothetical protein E2A64_10400 [Pseudohoeflea suaedae]
MELFLTILAWYACGLVGSALAVEFSFRRRGFDIDISLLVCVALLAALGPLNMLVGAFFTFTYFISGFVDFDRVILKARK